VPVTGHFGQWKVLQNMQEATQYTFAEMLPKGTIFPIKSSHVYLYSAFHNIDQSSFTVSIKT